MSGRHSLLVRIIVAAMSTVVMAIPVEVFFYFYTGSHSSLFKDRDGAFRVNLTDAQLFIDTTFDPDLGWDRLPIARNLEEDRAYLALSFGDSFTRGAEVVDQDTWQAEYLQLTGDSILNLGVDGYGIDQAILKFEKYGASFDAPYAFLALSSETYRRLLAYHSRYYFRNLYRWGYAFKPIFIRAGDGYELVKPPCTSAECLTAVLQDPPEELVQFLKTHDYWYQEYLQKTEIGVSYTAAFLRSFPRWLHQRRWYYGGYDYYFLNRHALELTKHLIERFADECERLGRKPLVLILNGPDDLGVVRRSGRRWDEPVMAYLEEAGVPFVDSTRFILDAWTQDADFSAVAAPGRHFNKEGNRLVARALAEFFVESPSRREANGSPR